MHAEVGLANAVICFDSFSTSTQIPPTPQTLHFFTHKVKDPEPGITLRLLLRCTRGELSNLLYFSAPPPRIPIGSPSLHRCFRYFKQIPVQHHIIQAPSNPVVPSIFKPFVQMHAGLLLVTMHIKKAGMDQMSTCWRRKQQSQHNFWSKHCLPGHGPMCLLLKSGDSMLPFIQFLSIFLLF